MNTFIHPLAKEVYPEWNILLEQAQKKFVTDNHNIPPDIMFSKKIMMDINPGKFSWMSGVSMKMVIHDDDVLPDFIDETEVLRVKNLSLIHI